MDIKELQAQLRDGVTPSPDYPDLPNDYTAEALIAFDAKAEIQYRMAKDRNPGVTRTMIVQNWKSYKIAKWMSRDGAAGGETSGGFLRKAAERLKKRTGGDK